MGKLCVKDGQKFLFIGDSITDCGRRAAERPYGNGYVSLFIELQRWMFPRVQVEYVNKGIGGNTVLDLRARWADDVLRVEPSGIQRAPPGGLPAAVHRADLLDASAGGLPALAVELAGGRA